MLDADEVVHYEIMDSYVGIQADWYRAHVIQTSEQLGSANSFS